MVARRVGAESGTQQLLMLHGIYGRGRNWLAVARLLVERRPDWSCWLADMRHHGDAHPGPDAGTLDALAGDIESWGADQGVQPAAVLGHSFGGKVALAHAARQATRPLQTWVIDSTPDAKPPSGSAWEMLGVVRALPATFRSRQEAIAGIEAGGFSTGVAQWMSTNLVHDAGAFRWRLDFDVMERLLHEFFQTSLWHVVDPGAVGHDIHVLKATQSSVISPGVVARLSDLQDHPRPGTARVHLHHREGGHWIHAEAPEVVVDLLAEWLPSEAEKKGTGTREK
jgi:pimeloyl-ACP methyl ester carboxylesterase